MKSLREAAKKGEVAAPLPGVRALGQRSGLKPPFTVWQLIGALESKPTPMLVEEFTVRGNVVTPTGTALRGFVDLTFRSNGTYKAHFHMRATGFPNYKFTTRALFSATNGLNFALQYSGNVEGTASGLDPRRDSDKDIEGFHPFIKDHWKDIKTGKLAVNKEYSATGVPGFIQDVAKIVLEVTAHVTGGALGATLGLGGEIGGVFGGLGVGSGFGLISGVAVFSAGGTLVLALPAGVLVGAVTNASVKQREINAEERLLAARVFGGALATAPIMLTNMAGIGGRKFTMPGGDKKIYVNMGDSFDNPMGRTKEYPNDGQLLIHELVHAWQIKYSTFLPGTICEGVVNQARNEFGGSAYNYGPPGRPWSKFNLEQQGAIVDEWYAGSRNGSKGPMDENDPYFMYIKDNIRVGRT